MNKKIFQFLLWAYMSLAVFVNQAYADDFVRWFCDSTLRLDYVLGGGPEGPAIFLAGQTKQEGWAGRKNNLKQTPVMGNGNILVTDPLTKDTLYNNCFSTLFQEWIYTPEAQTSSLSFENSFLVPLPLQDADITLTLRDNRHNEIARLTHRYKKDDVLIREANSHTLPYIYLHQGNVDNGKAIDLAILAEGYTQDEMDSFIEKARQISNEILSYKPFCDNKDKFNIIAVKSPSEESGVSIPRFKIWKDARYGSHFSTFYSDRYLTSPKVWKMHEDLEGIPYEQILVIVNTPEYGGGGIFNSYQIASADHHFTLPVSVHEFGHSFAGLADEYDYGDEEDSLYDNDIEPWEPNITTLVDFSSKWRDLINPDTPIPTPFISKPEINKDKTLELGVYEGGGYKKTGVYRPTVTCRMRDNYYPVFCPVCIDALQKTIDFYTD